MADDRAPEGVDPDFVVSPEQLQQMLAQGNPALIEAMQRGLQRLVGASSGYLESLPAPLKARISHLKGLQSDYEELEEKFEEEMKALEAKYRTLYAPLLEQRRAIIAGEAEAPENETAEGKAAAAAAEGEVPPGIPDFWATALSNHPELETRITDKDREVLAFVTDVREEDVLDEEGDEIGFKIVFAFRENPFLTDSELSVRFHMSEENGYMSVREVEGCDIHWRPEKDVTVKKMRKKPKPGSKGKAPATKLEPVESFFRWFTDAPEVPDNLDALGDGDEEEEEEMEELRDAVEAHMRVGEVLREEVVPNAVKWFTGEALLEMGEDEEDEESEGEEEWSDEDGEGDDDASEDDDEDDSGDEGGPGGAMPKDAKEQPAECKQQ